MDEWNTKQMTPFDCRVASPTLQITKLLIPYLPPNTQRIMAIYVKFIEFQSIFSTFQVFHRKSNSTQDIIQELRPYMPPSAFESIEQIQSMMNMMELFQSFQESSDANSDPMSMMKGMLSPEQENMFEMFGSMFAQEGGTEK